MQYTTNLKDTPNRRHLIRIRNTAQDNLEYANPLRRRSGLAICKCTVTAELERIRRASTWAQERRETVWPWLRWDNNSSGLVWCLDDSFGRRWGIGSECLGSWSRGQLCWGIVLRIRCEAGFGDGALGCGYLVLGWGGARRCLVQGEWARHSRVEGAVGGHEERILFSLLMRSRDVSQRF